MNQKYSFVVGGTFLNLTNTETGNSHTVVRDDPRFDKALSMLRDKAYADLEVFLDVKVLVAQASKQAVASGVDFVVYLENGVVYYSYKGGKKVALHNAIVDRIITMAQDGFDVVPMCRFMANLLSNPSQTAIAECYLFIEACELPITEDGHFIAYKIVLQNYMDIYTGNTVRHQVGDKPEMPRFEVVQDRNNTCAAGLHFCSKSYLPSYGSNSRETDRAVLVKINPANVVSIPSDYKNAKGRAWTYEVVGEVKGNWRDTLPTKDFTKAPVVSSDGSAYEILKLVVAHQSKPTPQDQTRFVFNLNTRRWHDTQFGKNNGMVSRRVVADALGLTTTEVEDLEV